VYPVADLLGVPASRTMTVVTWVDVTPQNKYARNVPITTKKEMKKIPLPVITFHAAIEKKRVGASLVASFARGTIVNKLMTETP